MLNQISPDLPSTTESPPKPFSFQHAFKKLPWTLFAMVLLVHLGILWWLMGAYFGRPQEIMPEPIFVTLEASEALPAEASAVPESAEPVKSAPDLNTPANTPVNKSVDISVDISVDKPAKPPVTHSVPVKRTPQSKSQEKPVSVPPERPREPSAVLSPAVAHGQTESAAQGVATNGPLSGGEIPRMVSRVDYLGASPNPVYPPVSRSRKQQGQVIVRVLISTTGTIETIRVLQTSGYEALDTAAINAFADIRFKPYAENGIPFKRLVDIPVEFALRN